MAEAVEDLSPAARCILLAAVEPVAGQGLAVEEGSKSLPGCDIVISSAVMSQLLVRHLDDDVKAKLQRRARRHGRSTEEEVREILRNAVREEDGVRSPLGSRLAARFADAGLEEDIPELRGQPVRPADFES